MTVIVLRIQLILLFPLPLNHQSNKYLVPRPPLEDDSHSISCQCTPENPCNDDSVCVNRASYFECSPDTCPVGELCQNQRMMKCQNADSYTFYTGARGWGLKTNHDIKEGDFVVEYVGEILDTAMCKERLRKSHEESTINFYMLTLEPGLVIDASQKSNHARFINHSCDPNCETQKWTVRGETRIGIFARQDIPKGTELTFDYHLDTLGNDKKRCLCGSKKCSGFLGLKLKGEPHRANPNKPKKAAKPKAKRRHSKQPVKLLPELDVDRHEDDCFVCGDGGELLLCDRQMCSKAYHLPCIGRKVVPPKHTKWECPRHYCQVCQKSATVFCVSCPVSFCDKHRVARFLDENGQLYCLENCRMTFSDCQQDSSGIDQP